MQNQEHSVRPQEESTRIIDGRAWRVTRLPPADSLAMAASSDLTPRDTAVIRGELARSGLMYVNPSSLKASPGRTGSSHHFNPEGVDIADTAYNFSTGEYEERITPSTIPIDQIDPDDNIRKAGTRVGRERGSALKNSQYKERAKLKGSIGLIDAFALGTNLVNESKVGVGDIQIHEEKMRSEDIRNTSRLLLEIASEREYLESSSRHEEAKAKRRTLLDNYESYLHSRNSSKMAHKQTREALVENMRLVQHLIKQSHEDYRRAPRKVQLAKQDLVTLAHTLSDVLKVGPIVAGMENTQTQEMKAYMMQLKRLSNISSGHHDAGSKTNQFIEAQIRTVLLETFMGKLLKDSTRYKLSRQK